MKTPKNLGRLVRLFSRARAWDDAGIDEALGWAADELEARRAGQDSPMRARLLSQLHELSCGDVCRLGKTQGQHTNSGCRCLPRPLDPWDSETRRKVLRALSLWRELAERPEAAPTRKP
jgi:hypothetical protein